MSEKEKKVLALIDYENMRHGVRLVDHEALGPWLMRHLLLLGPLAFAFAIVDVTLVDRDEAQSLSEAGFLLLHSPKSRVLNQGKSKDTVDPVAVEVLHRVLAECAGVNTVALASGDRDFNPALQTWKQRGMRIVVLGHSGISQALRENADEVYDLRPTAQRALEGFRRCLKDCKSPEEFAEILHPSIVMIRDEVARYLRQVVQQYKSSGKPEDVSWTFMIRGLRKHFPAWEQHDVESLVEALIETMLTVNRQLEGRRYSLDEFHPFVRFALATIPSELDGVRSA